MRRVAHIDMDAFFASCELSQYPELRGVPMVVGGRRSDAPTLKPDGAREFASLRDYVGRGVLTTASYEARKLGVRFAMPTMTAARLALDAIILDRMALAATRLGGIQAPVACCSICR